MPRVRVELVRRLGTYVSLLPTAFRIERWARETPKFCEGHQHLSSFLAEVGCKINFFCGMFCDVCSPTDTPPVNSTALARPRFGSSRRRQPPCPWPAAMTPPRSRARQAEREKAEAQEVETTRRMPEDLTPAPTRLNPLTCPWGRFPPSRLSSSAKSSGSASRRRTVSA